MRLASRLPLVLLASLALGLPAAQPAAAQCVSLTTLGSAYTQNFDTLSNTAGSTTNNLTIPGWFMTETGGGARDNEQYGVDTGGSTTGDTYSYGAAASTERALGGLQSGTLIPNFGACFTNNTGSTITNLAVAWTGEEWRLGTAARTDQLNFEYSLNATDLVTGTWTNVVALDFVTPDTVTTGAKNGNAAGDRTALSTTVSSLSIANGATFWIRFTDVNASGADDGLAVDDFSLTPNAVVVPNLTINDVSLNEGNAGTTSFTFTVSLSSPAGAGGVTFDIATADNTATQPSDYTQKSLTAQTIPAGSSTYSFTVLVNGDTTPETNETFFVNVTNVTGATVTDGQGQGTIVNDDAAPNLTINDVSLNEGNAGTTTFTFTVSLSAPAPAGGVTFDIATANGTATQPSDYTQKTLTSQTIPAGSSTYTFDVLVNGDTTPEQDETFFVNVTNVTNAIATDGQGQGTIVNDDITKIHDVQGNGAATPMPGATVIVEGVVTANFQGTSKLQGFFLQEEDADADADPQTSEGIFIFCSSCPTAVAEGQRVRAKGTVSEFNNMTEITASTAPSVVVTDAGNHLAEVTPAPISLPVVGDINTFYEAFEGMLVTFVDTLTVSEYFQLGRFGQIVLTQGGRSYQFTEQNPPNVAGNTAHLDAVARREVILDDDNNAQEWYLTTSSPPGPPDGSQFVFYPQANGGFSVGTQGTDFFRGGDLVNGLTGVLHWSFPGFGPETWRIRPAAAHPTTFTVANPRPATPPAVGGAIKAVGMNLLNYFTTIDTTLSSSTGPCGPSMTLDCRGADSVAELNRQRERASIVVCTLNADIYAFMELENTTPSDTINDLLGAINARCGGAHPYAFVNTGGTLGTDAIRVQMIYRTGIVSPVGSPLVDLDPVHNRPPTAQTFDVSDPANPAFGQRFTVIANHFKSKGCPGSGADADAGDGQSCFNGTRVAQATRLLTWINSTVLPAAGDPDVLLLGDFNSYAKEDPVTTLEAGGFTDLEESFDANTYSYLFNAELGHLDYGFASSSLVSQVTGAAPWHINADEVDLFDYNDEIFDSPGEATFEEKPDGSALTPPRVVFQPGTPYRASDHDPVLVGLFLVADLSITKTDGVTTAVPGGSVTYTITASNSGPDPVTGGTVTDTFPAVLTCTWTCVGAGGGTCTASGSGNISDTVNLPVGGSVTYTASCTISASATGSLVNTATVSGGAAGDSDPANNSATDTDTLTPQADLAVTKTDGVTTATPGGSVTYTITASNAGPSDAPGSSVSDTFPASLTCTWTCVGAGGGTCTASGSGNIGDTANLPAGGSVTYTASCTISASATGTLSNTATVAAPGGVTDPTPGNNSATDSDTLAAQADLAITKTDGVTTATPGGSVTYTITASNSGPSDASGMVSDTFPASLTCTWTCVGAGGGTCTASGSGNIGDTTNLPAGGSVTYTASCTISASATGTLSNTATVTAPGGVTDPTPGNNSATDSDTLSPQADLSVSKTDSPDPVPVGTNLTYTITVTNAGPSDAAGASLTDSLPAGTTFVSLASPGGWSCTTPAVGAGGTVSCTIATLAPGSSVFTLVVAVDPGTAIGTVLSNTATASSATADPNPGNESATATTTVAGSADLSVTKMDTPDPTLPGGTITYDIVVTNAGPSDAASVTLSDLLPAGTTFLALTADPAWSCTTPAIGAGGTVSCTLSSLAAMDSASISLTVAVDAGVTPGTIITNTATVSSTTSDPNPGNESATTGTTVSTPPPAADLSVDKVDNPDPVTAGSNLVYTITVNNGGPIAATTVNLIDSLPPGTTFVSLSSPGGWSCTTPAVGDNGDVTCSIPSLAVGSAVFTLTVAVDSGIASGTQIFNSATATSSTDDPNEGNNTGTATTTVVSPVSVSGTKTVSGTFTPGGTVTYTVVLTNSGPSAQMDNPGDEFTDVLPSSLTLVSAMATSGTAVANVGTNTVTWNGSIASGGSVTITITAIINSNVPPGTTISNQGNISFDADANGTNESSAVTDNPATGAPGDATTFQVAQQGAEIPTLDELGLVLLAALLALGGAGVLRRRRSA
jgi:uncharacterized repeat protein (TIGR01451 family)